MEKQPDVEILSEHTLLESFIKVSRVQADILTATGKRIEITREVHNHGDVATLLPIDKKNKKALLISQWRIPAWLNGQKNRLWEVVAGIIDPGETPEECAIRETLEETGYEIKKIRPVCNAFSSPGLVTERFYLYFGDYDENTPRHGNRGLEHEGEDILLKEFTFEDIFKMAEQGEIVDAKTLLAIQTLKIEMLTA